MYRVVLLLLVTSLAGGVQGAQGPDAVVDAANRVQGTFATVGEALAAAPQGDGPYRVLLRKGTYREKLFISRPNVQLVGEHRDGVVISWDDTGSTFGPDGKELGTWGSATLIVKAPGFRLENLTVENGFDYAANAALPEGHPDRVERMQAVALMTTGDSDKTIFESVTIRGFQDTLFANAGRHWFHNCRIEGHVDFIFGAGHWLGSYPA